MGSRPRLDIKERGKIEVLHSLNWSSRRIGKKIKRSHNFVCNYLKLKSKYGLKGKSGRKKSTSKLDRTRIIAFAVQKKMSSSQIKSELALSVSARTVRRVLANSPTIIYKKFIKKPPFTTAHKKARLEFATNSIRNRVDWSKIIWSDEKKFNLDGPDGCSYYWHDLRNEPEYLSKREFGGGSVMIWGAFQGKEIFELYFMETNFDSDKYTEMLKECLLPFIDKNDIFMHDNARIHSSMHTNKWIKDNKIKLLEWPSRSPDLNPIENVWGILTRRVFANGKQYKNKEELKTAIIDAWDSIKEKTLVNLVDSMPDRLISVISNNGGSTKY